MHLNQNVLEQSFIYTKNDAIFFVKQKAVFSDSDQSLTGSSGKDSFKMLFKM